MKRIDLNVDIGEGFDYDEALLAFATSANVCAGEHAGSWDLTIETIATCNRFGVRVGAHPGFPDRAGMGRRVPEPLEAKEWFASVRAQTERMLRLEEVTYVKPHGALYNLITGISAPVGILGLAVGFGQDLLDHGMPVMMLPVGASARQLGEHGLLIREGFADRVYGSDGRLMSREFPQSVIKDSERIVEQALWLAPQVDSLCLHGDTPDALVFAEMVFRALTDAGYEVTSDPR